MKNSNLTYAFIALLPLSLYAQDFEGRTREAYLDTDKNVDVDCFYSKNQSYKLITAVGETQKQMDKLSREFIIETADRKIPMSFSLTRRNGLFEYNVVFDKSHVSRAKFSYRDFFLAPVKDPSFGRDFETTKINCTVNLGAAAPVVINDGNYHISVHPHTVYDWQSLLKAPIEKYLNNDQYNSIILLDAPNDRDNEIELNDIMSGLEARLLPPGFESELQEVPVEVPIVVSPTGNNRFDIKGNSQINVTFSGGNHNYCMWNSTRHLIESLMNSKSTAKLNITYDMKAIVAQISGMEGMKIDFKRRDINKSNLLKNLLADQEDRQRYHTGYLSYFKGDLATEYAAMYKTFKINYNAEGFNSTVTMHGQGTRNLEVNFIYAQ